MPLNEPVDKTRMFKTMLKGQAFSYFEHLLKKTLEAGDLEIPDNDVLECDIGLE